MRYVFSLGPIAEVRTHPEIQKLIPRNYQRYQRLTELPVRVRPTTRAKEEVEEVEPKTRARPEMGLKEEARMLLMHSDDETWLKRITNCTKKKTEGGDPRMRD